MIHASVELIHAMAGISDSSPLDWLAASCGATGDNLKVIGVLSHVPIRHSIYHTPPIEQDVDCFKCLVAMDAAREGRVLP